MTAFVRHAVDNGFAEICFLDHLTITEAARPMTMAVEEVPIYFQAVQHLKRTFADRIAVKAGLEIEFDPRHAGLFTGLVGDFAFDVIGSSIHQLDGIDIVSGPTSRKTKPSPEPGLAGFVRAGGLPVPEEALEAAAGFWYNSHQ